MQAFLKMMTSKESADYSLGEIARRAAIVFAAEGWTWYGTDHVPSAVEIKDAVYEFVMNSRFHHDVPSGSGRLVMYNDPLRNGGVTVALELGGLSGVELKAAE